MNEMIIIKKNIKLVKKLMLQYSLVKKIRICDGFEYKMAAEVTDKCGVTHFYKLHFLQNCVTKKKEFYGLNEYEFTEYMKYDNLNEFEIFYSKLIRILKIEKLKHKINDQRRIY